MDQKKIVCKSGILFVTVLVWLTSQNLCAQNKSFTKEFATRTVYKAGAATSNKSPFLDAEIVGNWTSPPAIYIHDQLHARCLVLDDGITMLVFVVVENISINREIIDEAKWIIKEETHIPEKIVMVSAIYTHSATNAQGDGARRGGWNYKQPFDDYQKFLVRRIADVVRVAIYNLEPSRIGWGAGSVPQHIFNRRWKMVSGKLVCVLEKEYASRILQPQTRTT